VILGCPFSIMRSISGNYHVFLKAEDSMYSFSESHDLAHGNVSASPRGQFLGSEGGVRNFTSSYDILNESQLREMDVIVVDHYFYNLAKSRGWDSKLNDVVAEDCVIFDVGAAFVAAKP